jgi:hypothetical protein
MARATQGLQIVLIISVMLNVVLGVTTYLYNKQAFEKTNAAAQAAKDKQTADAKTQETDAKFDRLKKVVGLPDADIDQIETKLGDRQQEFGIAPKAVADASKPAGDAEPKPVGAPGYDQMVERLFALRDDRTNELKTAKQQVAVLETTFHRREADKDATIAKLDQGLTAEKGRNDQIVKDNQEQQANSARIETSVAQSAKAAGEKANAMIVTTRGELEREQKLVKQKDAEMQPLIKKIRDNERQDIDPPSGEVTWVSLPTKTVWINRGRTDSLPRGVRMTVYSAESNTAAKAVEKGTIEVTRIVADHQAECRIVDDKFADPMTTGDKVFTAFWSPGQQNHFALAGIMNLDGDGRNQVNTAIGLVKSYGGVVDCWVDDRGRRQGEITASTQYIIKGDMPDKSSPELAKNSGDIERDAAHNQLRVWTLSEFKQRLNYQKSSSVERFGAGASSGDSGSPAAPARAPKAAKAPAASKAEDDFGK